MQIGPGRSGWRKFSLRMMGKMMNLPEGLTAARLLKHGNADSRRPCAKPGTSASRFRHRLSDGRLLHLAVWQRRSDGKFCAIVRGRPEVFLGETHVEAISRLLPDFEGGALADVKIAW
jgi:hypothetical protein